MRGIAAKKIRKEVYGDQSLRQPRRYVIQGNAIVNTGLRRRYQEAKKTLRQAQGDKESVIKKSLITDSAKERA